MLKKVAHVAKARLPQMFTPYHASWWIADFLRRRLVGLRSVLGAQWADLIADDYIQQTRYIYKDRIDDELVARFLLSTYEYYEAGLDSNTPFAQRPASLLYSHFQRLLSRPDGPKSVLDIGCGNAEFLTRLAEEFPDIQFIGMDFLIPPEAKAKNVRLVKGYALDDMEKLGQVDCVFTQFTSVNILPLELENYFKLYKRMGVKWVLFNEPTRRRARVALDSDHGPRYLGAKMWAHNYPRVARQGGYAIEHFTCQHWSKHIEPRYNRVRKDTFIVQMIARLQD